MDLDSVFREIVSELDAFDETREKIMVLGRKGVRSCSEAIKKLHRKEDGVEVKLDEARQSLKSMLDIAAQVPAIHLDSYFEGIYQEFVEANLLQQILGGNQVSKPSEFDPPVPAVAYLGGLCDAIGELRRAILDCIRDERFEDANRYFDTMEVLHDHVNSLDYPNAVIPDIRHKSDVNRKLIHSTRSELTMAMHINRLSNKLTILDKE
jgi:translin